MENENGRIKKVKEKNAGITLIVLIITIIVLLILAGVLIATLTGQNGILTQAQRVKNETENATKRETEILDEYNQYLNNVTGGGETSESTLNTVTGTETSNTTVQDKFGNKVIVPAGFEVVNPDEDVTKGIVIQDVSANGEGSTTIGNQFVWVPVGDIITDENGTKTTITLGRYDFVNSRRNTSTNI